MSRTKVGHNNKGEGRGAVHFHCTVGLRRFCTVCVRVHEYSGLRDRWKTLALLRT